MDIDNLTAQERQIYELGFKNGKQYEHDMLTKDAVESEVWNYASDTDLRAIPIWGIEKFQHLKDGDKVKLIILPKED